MGVVPACVSVPHTCGAHGGQKKTFYPLKLELKTVVTLCDLLGIEPQFP